jgi:hypothetical protein
MSIPEPTPPSGFMFKVRQFFGLPEPRYLLNKSYYGYHQYRRQCLENDLFEWSASHKGRVVWNEEAGPYRIEWSDPT